VGSPGKRPYVVAIVGAGPSGIYAAEALSQQSEVPVRVVVIDRLPVPFGLVRYGVAPDHHSIRSIRNTLERTLEKTGVLFFGNVHIGADLTIAELRRSVDAVIYAYGAGTDRRLGIPGEALPGSIAASEFVAWYCGHPDVHPDLDVEPAGRQPALELINDAESAVVVGVGNVALDVARVLIKSADDLSDTDMADEVLESLAHKQIRNVHILGRRGPAYTAFTTKELRELDQLPGVNVIVDSADLDLGSSSQAVLGRDRVAARNVAVLQDWAARPPGSAPKRIVFHFWTKPVRILGSDRVEGVEVERTQLDPDGGVVGTGERSVIAAQLVVRSVGYRGVELPGVPFDPNTGRVPHAEGRVIRDGRFSQDEYVTGWIKRGPTGVIGTNKSDAVETVTSLLADIRDGAIDPRAEPSTLDRLLSARGIEPLGMPAWHRIDAAEIELGLSHGRPRTTLPHRSELLAAAERSGSAGGDPFGGRHPTSHERLAGQPWDASYHDGPAPWDIGGPQPAIVRLASEGGFAGAVLDAGCGTGENALHLASMGLSVLGVDVAKTALAIARQKADERGIEVEFAAADALHLEGLQRRFETVLDCGLFHTFDGDERRTYVESLASVTEHDGTLYVWCFRDDGPDTGPHPVSAEELRAAFNPGNGWSVVAVERDRISTRYHDHGAPAWFATIKRTQPATR